MPSTRRLGAPFGLVLVIVPAVVAAQPAAGVDRPVLSPVVRGVGAVLTTLIVGGLLLTVAPRYVDRTTRLIHDETVVCFGWGILVFVLFVGTTVLLAVTVVGLVLLIPLAIATVLLGVLGNALGYLGLFGAVIDSRWLALGLGAAFAGVASAVPVLGDIVGFIVGSLGVGAVVRDWRA